MLAALSILFVSPALAQGNLVTFGDFESFTAGALPGGAGYFTQGENTDFVIDNAVAHTGSQSLRVDYPGGAANSYSVQFVATGLAVTPGEEYTMSVWARSSDASGGQANFVVQNTSYGSVGADLYGQALTDEWQEYSVTFTMPEATSEVQVALHFGYAENEGESVYVDDLSLTQASDGGEAPAVVINEVDADQADTDAAEFVELFNAGEASADLSGYVLVFFNGSNDASYNAVDLDGVTIEAGGYFVYCGDTANVANCDVEAGTGTTNLIQNGADAVALILGDAASYPTGTAAPAEGILDAIVYGTNDADDVELLAALGQTVQYNDTVEGSIQRSPDGADTFVTEAPTPGAVNYVAPVAEPVEFAFGFESLDGIGSWTNTSSDPGLTLSLSDDAAEGDNSLQVVYDFVADESWGGSVDFNYAPSAGFVDLSGADGITFWYKTVEPVSNETEVAFAVKLVDASAESGVDNYEARVPVVITDDSGEWQQIEIPFSSFALPSWITPQDPTFDLDAISRWEMQVVVGTPGVGNTYAGEVLLDGLALYTEAEPSDDLVTNGGFEDATVGVVTDFADGVDGWLFEVNAAVTTAPEFAIVDDVVYEGDQALRVTVNEASSSAWHIQAVAVDVPVTPGETYVFSAWARSQNGGGTAAFTAGNAAFNEYGALRDNVTLTDEWQEFTFEFTINDEETVARAPIHFSFAANADNAVYIDAVSIEAVVEAPEVVINELLVSTGGTDTEFIELGGAAGTSLDGLTLIVIEGDEDSSAGIGSINQVIELSGSIPEDGYWLAASPEAVSQFSLSTEEVDQEIADNSFQNGTGTFLLVMGFNGALGDDLDSDDDGTADSTPWDTIVDGIALADGGINADPADAVYFDTTFGPDGDFLPAGVYRSPDLTGSFMMLEFSVPAASATPGEANVGDTPTEGGLAESGLSLVVANPIRGAATVQFELAAPGAARVALYDVLGRQVAVLADGEVGAGPQTARVDAAALATGVYVLRLETEGGALSRTVTVVR